MMGDVDVTSDRPSVWVARMYILFNRHDNRRIDVLRLAAQVENTENMAERYADALLAIVGMPWPACCDDPECWFRAGASCPCCRERIEDNEHTEDCAWLIAARALGVQ